MLNKSLTSTEWARQNHPSLDQQVRQLLSLFSYMDRNPEHSLLVQYNRKQALAQEAPVEIWQAGEHLKQLFRQYNQLQSLGIGIYGRWCGPGYGKGEPVDRLDARCKEHDECYKEMGYFACSCNESFIAGVWKDYPYMKPTEQKMAVLLVAYFTMAPCRLEQGAA
jgi:hypothetical protein